ncbi:MAG: B3/B4 domain-containing protein [Candidatus Aminicenantia bacterium]
MRKIIVEKEIFERFSGFKRGVLIIKDIKNHTFNHVINDLLNEQINIKKGKNLVDEEFVRVWDEIHKNFGSNPNKFPPSIKSLIKRVDKGDRIPFINSVVALFNYISLKYLIPCGGDDIEEIKANLRLGFANGDEIFIPLGGKDIENPMPGEVIYYEDKSKKVMCRRWNWRNGDFSKIKETSKRIVVNFDGAGIVPESLIIQARDEMANILSEKCSAVFTSSLLCSENNEVEIDI